MSAKILHSEARITIGMPVYNAEAYVAEAVASILAQTFEDWRLMVIDDGSTDGTAERVAAFSDSRIRLVSDSHNLGLPARLNQAVSMARSPLFARMDGDDIAYPERFQRQLAYLDAHPDCDVVATEMLVISPQGRARGLEKKRGTSHESIVAKPWNGFHFNHATWLGRTAWFRRHPYRPEAVRSEDDDLLLRAFGSSRFARLDEILYAYRVGELRLASILRARRSFSASLIREAIRQRRPALLRGVPLQALKSSVDAISIVTGLDGHLLKHRAGALPKEVEKEWQAIRRVVSQRAQPAGSGV